MPVTSIYYRFSQNFHVKAERAFKWCTDYDASDVELMHDSGRRTVTKLSENAFILVDSSTPYDRKRTSKTRLVCLYPEELFWTSTTIAGANRYSQFLYRITPDGKDSSKLEFIGLHLEHRKISERQGKVVARSRKQKVIASWKYLASVMESDVDETIFSSLN